MSNIGDRLKYIRKLHDLNQEQFSQSIHVSQGRLSELEQGKCKPSAETLMSIAQEYNVDLNWLVLGKNDESKPLSSLEKKYLELFNKLQDRSKEEIIEFIKFRIGG